MPLRTQTSKPEGVIPHIAAASGRDRVRAVTVRAWRGTGVQISRSSRPPSAIFGLIRFKLKYSYVFASVESSFLAAKMSSAQTQSCCPNGQLHCFQSQSKIGSVCAELQNLPQLGRQTLATYKNPNRQEGVLFERADYLSARLALLCRESDRYTRPLERENRSGVSAVHVLKLPVPARRWQGRQKPDIEKTAMTTHPTRESKRPLFYAPNQLTSPEPHVIVQATFVTPDYLGGGSIDVDVMVSTRAYARIMRKAA